MEPGEFKQEKMDFTRHKFAINQLITGDHFKEIYKLCDENKILQYLQGHTLRFSDLHFFLNRTIEASISGTFLKPPSESILVSFDYQVYKSWWQMFKRACFPKWLLRKSPAKTTTISTVEKEIKVDHFYGTARDLDQPPDLRYFFTNFKPEDEGLNVREE